MAHAVEREIIKITSYKSRTKFDDRQDYLSSILNASMKLTDDDFDNISNEAAAWINAAVLAHNTKEDIPDFDEVEPAEADPEEADDEADEDAEDGDDSTDSEDPMEDSDSDDDTDAADDVADSGIDSDDDGSDEEAEKPTRAKKAKAKIPPKPVKAVVKPEKVAKPVKQLRPKPDDDVVLDKWGCMEGSKNSRALNLFAKGATAKEVKDDLGGTYYNILKKMVEDGHTIEKDGAIIKLIHKDDKGKKVEKLEKAPAKKPKK